MPSSDGQRDRSIRNRENQRNFRARRQQYVQELEQKVRAREKDEIEVIKHIQAAARCVVAENRILRALLRERFGMSEEDVHRYLATLRATGTASEVERPQIERKDSRTEKSSNGKVVPKRTANVEQPETGAKGLPVLRSRTAVADDPIVSPTQCHETSSSKLSQMSSDQAAAIITSIRSNATIAEIRQELGRGFQDGCENERSNINEVKEECV